MIDLAMNLSTNDLLIQNGDLSLVSGSDAIAQNLQQVLGMYYGEWFLDTTVGIPYRQYILVKNPNIDLVESIILDAAQNADGITAITDYSMSYNAQGRAFSVYMEAQDSTGETITVQTPVGPPTLPTLEGTPT